MRKATIVLALFGGFAASAALGAVYSGTCTTAPEAQWMAEAAIKAKIAEAGYTVAKLKRTPTGNRYEAYVTDKGGKRMELFLDPTDAKIVHSQ